MKNTILLLVSILLLANTAFTQNNELYIPEWAYALSPDGQYAYVADRLDNSVRVISFMSKKDVARLEHPETPLAVFFDNTDSTIVSIDSRTLKVWNGHTFDLLKTTNFQFDIGFYTRFLYNANSKILCIAYWDRLILINLENDQQEVYSLNEEFKLIDFNDDGTQLFYTNDKQEINAIPTDFSTTKFQKIAKSGNDIRAIDAGKEFIFVVSADNNYNYAIDKYTIDGKHIESRELNSYTGFTTGFGELNSFSVSYSPQMKLIGDEYILLQTNDGLMVLEFSKKYRQKFVKSMETISYSHNKSFKLVGSNIYYLNNTDLFKFDMQGQETGKVSIVHHNDGILAYNKLHPAFIVNAQNILFKTDTTGEVAIDTLLNKPNGVYVQTNNLLVFASLHNTLEVWNINDFKQINEIQLKGSPLPVALSVSDNQVYVARANSGSIDAFQLNGKRSKTYEISNKAVTALCVINDTAFVGTSNGSFITYSLKNEQILNEEKIFFDGISCIETLHHNTLVAGNGRFAVKYPTDTTIYYLGHNDFITSVDMTVFDKRVFAVTNTPNDPVSRLWDLDKHVLLQNIALDSAKNISKTVFLDELNTVTASSTLFKTTDNDSLAKSIRGINIQTKFETANSGGETGVKLSPGNRYILMFGGNTVKVWDVISGQILNTINVKMDFFNDAEILNDERTLVVNSGEQLQYYDIFTGLMLKTKNFESKGVLSMHQLRSGPINTNYLIAFNKHGWHQPYLIHTTTGKLIQQLPIPNTTVHDIQCSNKGELIAIYGYDAVDVYKWNDNLLMGKGEKVLSVPYKTGEKVFYANKKISFSGDDSHIALMFFEDGKPYTRIYNLETKALVSTVSAIAGVGCFGYDDIYIYSEPDLNAMNDQYKIVFYNYKTGEKLKTLNSSRDHQDLVQELVYIRKYDRFISVDNWGNFKFWDGITGAAIAESNRFDNDVYTLEISDKLSSIFYAHKQGVYQLDLNNLSVTKIENARNYPLRLQCSNNSNIIYYFSERDKNGMLQLLRHNRISKVTDTLLAVNEYKDLASIGSLKLSKNNKYLGFTFNDNTDKKLYIVNLQNKDVMTIPFKEGQGFLGFHPVKENILLLTNIAADKQNDGNIDFSREVFEYDLLKNKKTAEFFGYQFIIHSDFLAATIRDISKLSEVMSPDGRFITSITGTRFLVHQLPENKEIYSVLDGDIASVAFSKNSDGLFILSNSGVLSYIQLPSGKEVFEIKIGLKGKLHLLKDDRLVILGENDEIVIYNWEKQSKIASVFIQAGNELAVIDRNNYYYASPGAIKNVIFRTLTNVYGFEQFDLYYNKPHEVLKSLGSDNPSLYNAYKQAWEKRNTLSNIKQPNLKQIQVPVIGMNKDNIPLNTNTPKLKFNIELAKNTQQISSLNVWVNNVPLYGKSGRQINNNQNQQVEIELSEGVNNIQVSCSNSEGIESLKEHFEVAYTPESESEKTLYVCVISVSEYQDQQYNLRYAVKDGRDLAKLFAGKTALYDQIIIDTLFDRNATIENVQKLKQILLQSGVDDEVILFVSGHGLLDDNYDFYFASHDIDFNNPAKRGISYERLEWLLDSIPARKKLFMMDACHSGEVDKAALVTLDESATGTGLKSGVKAYSYRAAVLQGQKKETLGLSNSFELMQELFTNLNRGSGAVVISAAAGDSYALESDEWNNGVFTFSVLSGLQSHDADINKDGTVNVSELRAYVIKNVQQLTNGQQKPTSRQENVEFDFRVW